MKKQTLALHTPYHRRDAYDALSMPVYNAVAFEFDDAATMSDAFTSRIDAPDYSRIENPTVTHFEEKVKALTGAEYVIALNSGMAAISNTLIALAGAGKNIVTSRHLFGNTFTLLTDTLGRFGVEVRLADLTDPASVEPLIDENTCALYFEIITNPQMEVADTRALAAIAHARNVPVVADTTMIPFTQFSASSLGVDIEVVSSTKYISGGATSLGGLVIDYGTCEGFGHRMKNELVFNLGAYMTPQVAYMQTLGLETLGARYAVQSSNALAIAKALTEVPGIINVNYTGLENNRFHDLAASLYGSTSGAMICIELESREACFSFLNNLKLIHRATNLFDNRTLAIHPASTIFGLFSDEKKAELDVSETTVRLSIGLESWEDLLEDIKSALR